MICRRTGRWISGVPVGFWALSIVGLLGLAQTTAFTGYIFDGVPPGAAHPASGITVSLYGDDDALPDNGPLVLLTQTTSDAFGAFTLTWTAMRISYACFHVRAGGPSDPTANGAAAQLPGAPVDSRTVAFLDVPPGVYSGIAFWVGAATAPTGPLPDLVVESLEIDPSAPAVGETVSVRMTIGNRGTAPAAGFSIRFLIDGAPLSATLSIGGLSPGGSATVGTQIYHLAAGAHHVVGIIDPDDHVAELDEGNNRAEATLAVGRDAAPPTAALPDLTSTSTELSPRVAAAHVLRTLTCEVTNLGSGLAPATLLDVSDSEGAVLTSAAVPTLEPGEEAQVSLTLLPMILGEQTIVLRVDPRNAVPESDEENNETSLALWVEDAPLPDLTILGVEASATVAGVFQWITVHVENRGLAAAGTFTVGAQSAGTPLGPPAIVDELSFDEAMDVVLFLPTTATAFTLMVDPEDWIPESDETNNQWLRTGLPAALPDLSILAFSVSPDSSGGEGAMKTSITIANIGTATAEAAQLLVAVADAGQLDGDASGADEAWLIRLSVEDLPDLPSGTTWTWEDSWTLDGPAPELTLIVEVDPFNLIAESGESNNAARIERFVPGGES